MTASEHPPAQGQARSRFVPVALTLGSVVFLAMLVYLVVLVIGMHRRTAARSERIEKARALVADASVALDEKDFVRANRAYQGVLALLPDAQSRLAEEEDLASAAEKRIRSLAPEVERLHKEAEKARKEQERACQLAEAKAAEERRAAEAKAEAQRKQREEEEQVRTKAKEMYPSYKKAAELLADELLKLLSATEVGITYQDHMERLQDMQFSYNKLVLANGGEASLQQYSSFRRLKDAVDELNRAQLSWKRKNELGDSFFENQLQEHWKAAQKHYSAAMAALARNE
ncbi:MAG: hypothetical protein JXQ75_17030 [Phycisphaerae bacterium]|nr:hypothetical protein [Phycisphaerae bacterium]